MTEQRRRGWTDAPRPPRPPRRRPRRPPSLPTHDVRPPRAVAALAKASAVLARDSQRMRGMLAAGLAVFGLLLTILGAWADVTVHRGVGDGITPPIVRQYTGRDLATNADLTRFTPDQLPAVVSGLQANGIRFVRQSFAWAEIEPAPGEYAWERYDAIVDALTRHGITPVAVLHRSPAWIRSPGAASAFDAPPADLAAFQRFVTALVSRYGDRLPFVQVWDLPNRRDRWGGSAADATAYTALLGIASNAARGANPNAIVLLAELDPFPDAGNPDDLRFLRAIYAAGGSAFFDVVAARVDGGVRSPYDRAIRSGEPSLSRAVLLREVMQTAGDGETPIWATHYGWQVAPAGALDAGTQAAYVVAGIERAREEWPWMGPLFQWGLIPGPNLGGETPPGFALLTADGAPAPAFTELGAFAARGADAAAPTGLAPVSAAQYIWEGNWEMQHLAGAIYRTTTDVDARFHLRFAGTGVIARARSSQEAASVAVTIDDQPVAMSLESFQAQDVDIPLARRLPEGVHDVTMQLTAPGELTFGGLVVERAIPMQWPVILLIGGGALLLFLGLFDGALLIAERAGWLEQRDGELWPELPHIPEWRPARRA